MADAKIPPREGDGRVKLPKALSFWIEQFMREGESRMAATRHAIDRCYESGDLSESQVDKYEAALLAVVG